MNLTSILAEKKENSLKLKKTLGILLKFKPLGLIILSNEDLTHSLIKGLKFLPAGFVIYVEGIKTEILSKNVVITGSLEGELLSGFDFIVTDNKFDNIDMYISLGITPIVNRDNIFVNGLLEEFNPIQNTGNSFFYEKDNKWDIFYTIVRYMENYKFPFDNKNLVKNVLNNK
ncbi:hypothetical protein LRZ95_00160 [Candidatus Gracilibacteria bacterium]|nr:hypothetical protein [Candidatus Gracilibacteria bacterium]